MARTATFWPFLGWILLLLSLSSSLEPTEATARTTAFAFCARHILPSQRGRTGRTTTATTTATTTTCLSAKKQKATKNKKASPKAKAASSSVGFGRASGKWDGCEPLRAWLRERGAEVDGLNVGVEDPAIGLRGVTAARAFKRGDVLFSVPRDSCILDETKADASPMAALLYPTRMEREALPPPMRTALFLLWIERMPAELAAWAPAFAVFPTPQDFEVGGPMQLWTQKEVEAVACGQLILEVHTRKLKLRDLYDTIVLPKWQAACDDATTALAGMDPPTFADFQHKVCVVTSRNYGEGEVTGGTSSMLVPGVDLCNHDDPPCINTRLALAPWGSFVVLASKSIAAKEAIKLTYGPLPNRLLLAQFGFLLTDRETPLQSDTAYVRIDSLFGDSPVNEIDLAEHTVAYETTADAAWRASAGPMALLNLKGTKDSSGRISRWQPALAARSAANMIAQDDVEGGKLFRGMVERELALFCTTLAEDLLLLQDTTPLSLRTELAVRFRVESRRLLQKELDAAACLA